MSLTKVAIPVMETEVSPRFDLSTEVVILTSNPHEQPDKKQIVLPRSSADDLCHILLSEKISTLICCAIEDEYYEFLKWKKIRIYDSIIGSWEKAYKNWQTHELKSGDIFSSRIIEGIPLET